MTRSTSLLPTAGRGWSSISVQGLQRRLGYLERQRVAALHAIISGDNGTIIMQIGSIIGPVGSNVGEVKACCSWIGGAPGLVKAL
jgi:hypothetical protein